jgi:hypothetical protein
VTDYELLSILIACIALIISLVVWTGQRKLQREANDLQRITAELSKKQLQILEREELSRNKTRIAVGFERAAPGTRFKLSNVGKFDATEINLRFAPDDPKHSPVPEAVRAATLPIARLLPGESVLVLATLYLEGPAVFDALVSWKDPDGSDASYQTRISTL